MLPPVCHWAPLSYWLSAWCGVGLLSHPWRWPLSLFCKTTTGLNWPCPIPLFCTDNKEITGCLLDSDELCFPLDLQELSTEDAVMSLNEVNTASPQLLLPPINNEVTADSRCDHPYGKNDGCSPYPSELHTWTSDLNNLAPGKEIPIQMKESGTTLSRIYIIQMRPPIQ